MGTTKKNVNGASYDLSGAETVLADRMECAELERIAETCPVRLSLLAAIEVPLVVRWGD